MGIRRSWGKRHFAIAASVAMTGCSFFVSLDDLTGGAASGNPNDGAIVDGPTADAKDASANDAAESDTSPASCLETDDPSLVAYYPLDETSGTVAHDCSGHGHDGVVSGSPAGGGWGPGHFGGGYAPDGSSGCIDLGVPSDLLLEDSSFTVAAWASAHSYSIGTGPAAASRYIIGRTTQPNTTGWRLGTDWDDIWSQKYHDQGSDTTFLAETATGQATDQWTHVASTFGGGVVTLYIDGSAVTPTQPLTTVTADTTATVRIGCRSPGDTGFFEGTLDEVRVYNRALSADEIATLAAKMK